MRLHPKSCIRWFHNVDSNCFPWSVVTVDGTPNLEIHPWTKTCATVSVADWQSLWPSGETISASQQISKSIGRWQGTLYEHCQIYSLVS